VTVVIWLVIEFGEILCLVAKCHKDVMKTVLFRERHCLFGICFQ